MAKVLHLTLKKKWFDLIRSGLKTEEYREIKKYWIRRYLCTIGRSGQFFDKEYRLKGVLEMPKGYFKHFDIIRFTNGYSKNAPTFDIECKGISIGIGKPEWGGSGETFIIHLGKILN